MSSRQRPPCCDVRERPSCCDVRDFFSLVPRPFLTASYRQRLDAYRAKNRTGQRFLFPLAFIIKLSAASQNVELIFHYLLDNEQLQNDEMGAPRCDVREKADMS